MAVVAENYQKFCDKNMNSAILKELKEQKSASKYCDVILKVFDNHIPAHSNVLAAGSPYISAFLSQTLPRQYSQASPQIIELQIDDGDLHELYQIAVHRIVDFIYSGEIELDKTYNAKVLMIAKILQIDKVVELCETFASDSESEDLLKSDEMESDKQEEGIGHRCQPISDTSLFVYPGSAAVFSPLSLMDTDETPETAKDTSKVISSEELPQDKVSQDEILDANVCDESSELIPNECEEKANRVSRRTVCGRGRGRSFRYNVPKSNREVASTVVGSRKSPRTAKPKLNKLRGNVTDGSKICEYILKESLKKSKDHQAFDEFIVDDSGEDNDEPEKSLKCPQCNYKTANSYHFKRHLTTHIGGKYSCEYCTFATVKLKELAVHQKEHQHEQNLCSFCDYRAENGDDFKVHLAKHEGPCPYFCQLCDKRFKTNTQLKFHIPKHSDVKPFVCSICSMGFKWKHALKSHMIVHSGEKSNLCDICGYATAHKSQLKAHHLIHTGETFKCNFPGCKFQAIKKQNMKYHQLTHTRERPHQCEICGQSFSLVKNLRRHMMLHSSNKPYQCEKCSFSTTRQDKLKEHIGRQHILGKTVEKQSNNKIQLLASIVDKSGILCTDVVTSCVDKPADCLGSSEQTVVMNPLVQAGQVILGQSSADTDPTTLTTISYQNAQVIPNTVTTIHEAVGACSLDQFDPSSAYHTEGSVIQTVELGSDTSETQPQMLQSPNIVALRPVQFVVKVVDLKQ